MKSKYYFLQILMIIILFVFFRINNVFCGTEPVLKLTATNETDIAGHDMFAIWFTSSGAFDDFDGIDVDHRENTDPITPNFYTIIPGHTLVNDARPPLTKDIFIPLGLRVPSTGMYNIALTSLTNFPVGTKIYLVDSILKSIHELTITPKYSFQFTKGTNETRFWVCIDIPVSDDPTSTFTAKTPVKPNTNSTITYTGNGSPTAIYNWNFDGGTVVSGSGAGPYTVKWAIEGTYNVKLIVKELCCKTSLETTQQVVVTQNIPSDSAVITPAGPTTFCEGESVVLNANTGANLTYQWKKNDQPIVGATKSSYTAFETASYTVVVTSAGIPATSSPVIVTVNLFPTAVISANGAVTFCEGSSVNITASTSADYTYQWKNNSTDISNATVSSYTAKTTAKYTVMITSKGCSKLSNEISVNVNPLPTSSIASVGNTTVCEGSAVVLNANTGSGLLYQWQKDNQDLINQTNSTYSATLTGIYTVNVKDINNCSKISNQINVTVNPLPLATITANGSLSFCEGSSVTITSNFAADFTYQWKKDNTDIVGATNSFFSAKTLGKFTVSITSKGCSKLSNEISVNVYPLPASTITAIGNTTVCEGSVVVLNANTGANLTYQWQKDNQDIPNQTNSTYSADLSGSFTVSIKDINNCSKVSNQIAVVVNALPLATISTNNGVTTICSGSSLKIDANTGANLTYQWKKDNTDIAGATNSSYAASSAGKFTVNITNINNCTKLSNEIELTINPKPIVTNTNLNLTVCSGTPLDYALTSDIIGSTFEWTASLTQGGATGFNNGKGNIINDIILNSAGNNSIVTYSVIAVSPLTCKGDAVSVNFTVLKVPSVNITTNTGNTTCFEGDSITLSTSFIAGYSYQWQKNGNIIAGETNNYFYAKETGSYSVVVVNNDKCQATSNIISITVYPKADNKILPSGPTNVCDGGTVILKLMKVKTYTYQWIFNNNAIPSATDTIYEATATGNYFVEIQTPVGLVYSDTLFVNILPKLIVNNIVDSSICDSLSITLDAGSGFKSYLWSTGETTQTITIDSTGANAGKKNIFVVLTDIYDCTATDSAVISFTVCINIADLKDNFSFNISPNPGDGHLIVDFKSTVLRNVKLSILNLQGQLIYKESISNAAKTIKNYNFSNLSKGIYLLRVETDKDLFVKKVVFK